MFSSSLLRAPIGAALVLSFAAALPRFATAAPQTPVYSYSGSVVAAGQRAPSGRRVAINSAGIAVIASQEAHDYYVGGTVVTWVTRNGDVVASTFVNAVNPLDMVLDSQDDVYISGYLTTNYTFDTGGAFDGCPSGSSYLRAVVVKVSAAAKQVAMEACIVAGWANGVAVDRAGVIHVVGRALSGNLPASPNALKSHGDGYDGFLVKLDAAGKLLYATYIGGQGKDDVAAITLDDGGSAYLTGTTDSWGLGTPGSFRPERIGSGLYRSLDQGGRWQAIGNGLQGNLVRMLARQPGNPDVVYAFASPTRTDETLGLFRSTDGGDNWVYVEPDPGDHPYYLGSIFGLLISTDSTLYVPYDVGLYRSTDGGKTWKLSAFPTDGGSDLSVGADGVLYLSGSTKSVYRSMDSGETWQKIFAANQYTCRLVPSSGPPSGLFLTADSRLYKSEDRGDHWTGLGATWSFGQRLLISPSNPAILYRDDGSQVNRSVDGGNTWTSYSQSSGSAFLVDASNPDVIYFNHWPHCSLCRLSGSGQPFVDTSSTLAEGYVYALASSVDKPGELLLATDPGIDAYVMKIAPDNHVSYFTYLGGYSEDYPTVIRLDADGNAYVAGFTMSQDFPVTPGSYQGFFNGGDWLRDLRPGPAGGVVDYERGTDGFIAELSSDGLQLKFGTYLGGSGSEIVTGLAFHPDGSLLVCGLTDGGNFPRTLGSLPVAPFSSLTSPFLVRFTKDGSAIQYATPLSGNDYGHDSWANSIAASPDGQVYVTGFDSGYWYRTPNGKQWGVAFVSANFPALADSPGGPGGIPQVDVAAVVNNATGVQGSISPGEIVSIYGSGLGPAKGVAFTDVQFFNVVSTILAGTQAFFDGKPAPVLYASATQVNAIVPYDAPIGGRVQVRVGYQGALSAGATLTAASSAPGIFTIDGSGSGQAVAVNQNGTLCDSAHPAAPGSYVTVYFTGGGFTSPPGADGSVNSRTFLNRLTETASATVGGRPTTVTFAGGAPNFVAGVGQLNLRLADDTPSGPAQPLILTVGSNSSPGSATIAVR